MARDLKQFRGVECFDHRTSSSPPHLLAIAGVHAEPSTATRIAARLAAVRDAPLTLVFPLPPLHRLLPAGTEAMAQREELRVGRSRLRRILRLARRAGRSARGVVREGDRANAVVAELADEGRPELIITPVASAASRWNVLAGRALDALLAKVEVPVLAIHEGDTLALDRPLRIAVVHRLHEAAIDALARCERLLPVAGSEICLYRVHGEPTAATRAEDPTATVDAIRERGFSVPECAGLPRGDHEKAAMLRSAQADLIVLSGDLPRRRRPFRGSAGRLVPLLRTPALLI